MNIAFIPIDNRPVCYTLPAQICAMNDNINLFMPERNLLGGLTKYADVEGIFQWLETLNDIDAFVICLDTIAYGGLISSRRTNDNFEEIKARIEKLRKIIDGKKVYAFSSIMRISNNNVNEEEKEYWNLWGKKIFEYSYNLDKFGEVKNTEIPIDILNDYIATRKRNFEINKLYLTWNIDTLIFSKDDCAQYGLNVREARELEKLGGYTKTGADEIPLTLLARAVSNVKFRVAPIFLVPECKDLISNYEDISIEKSVLGQLELAGCEVCDVDNADVLLYVNNFENHQGEIVMKIDTKPFSKTWQKPDKSYMIADVRFANGADNAFVKQLFDAGFDDKFYGYSAWNTSANTLGSLICGAKIRWAKNNPTQKENESFKKLQVTRFLDDWAYQANVRQKGTMAISDFMKPYERQVFDLFNVHYNTVYTFPWNRLFEVEIELN